MTHLTRRTWNDMEGWGWTHSIKDRFAKGALSARRHSSLRRSWTARSLRDSVLLLAGHVELRLLLHALPWPTERLQPKAPK